VGDRLRLAAQAAAEQPVAPVVEIELVHGASWGERPFYREAA
jgi:hypothetical protein